jgi:hypothetical protein
MKLETRKYKGETIPSVIRSLEADDELLSFCRAYNLSTGDVLEAIATMMVYDDPPTVEVDSDGRVR